MRASNIEVDFAQIGRTILHISFAADLNVPEQGASVFHALGAEPVLLIYDNVVSVESIVSWLPRAGAACHVLCTSLLDQWHDAAWHSHKVKKLTPASSLELVKELCGEIAYERFGERLAQFADGMPVEICPMAAALNKLQERGRLDEAEFYLVPEASGSFRAPYELLDNRARLLLHAASVLDTRTLPVEELFLHLERAADWTKKKM